MNFSKFIILLLLVSCSATEESKVSIIQTDTSTTSSTLVSQEIQEDDYDVELAFENFENYWETLLKEDNPLTFEELALTYNLNELMNEDFNWDEGTGAYFYLNEFLHHKVWNLVACNRILLNHLQTYLMGLDIYNRLYHCKINQMIQLSYHYLFDTINQFVNFPQLPN